MQTQCYDFEQKLTQANEQYLSAQESYDTKIRKLEEEKRQLNQEVGKLCVCVCARVRIVCVRDATIYHHIVIHYAVILHRYLSHIDILNIVIS